MPQKARKFDLYTFVAGAALEASEPFPLVGEFLVALHNFYRHS
jgi:hypothetical protein